MKGFLTFSGMSAKADKPGFWDWNISLSKTGSRSRMQTEQHKGYTKIHKAALVIS